jgi:NitT/TauT family transport system permease protein
MGRTRSAVAARRHSATSGRVPHERIVLGPHRGDRDRFRLCLRGRARRRLGAGIWLGGNRLARDVGEPMLSSLYSIPKITLYPVILLVFGLGISAKVAFGALHGIFPVALFTIGALKNTSPVLIKTARVLRLSPIEAARSVLLPAALPEIVTGLRIGFSATLLGTLIGELFASDQGLGFILIRAMEAHKVIDIMALTLLLFAFAALANTLLLVVERRMHPR